MIALRHADDDHNHHCFNVSRLNCSKLPIMIVLGDHCLYKRDDGGRNPETLSFTAVGHAKICESFVLYCITLYLIWLMVRPVVMVIHIAKVKVKPQEVS